jgi:hypothetical protein
VRKRRTGGGGGRRSGYSTKNKNPTCQCGEIQKRERKNKKMELLNACLNT